MKRRKCPKCGKHLSPSLFTSEWCMHCTGKLMDDIMREIGSVVALSFTGRDEDAADHCDTAYQWVRELPKSYNCGINLFALLDSIRPDVLRYKL